MFFGVFFVLYCCIVLHYSVSGHMLVWFFSTFVSVTVFMLNKKNDDDEIEQSAGWADGAASSWYLEVWGSSAVSNCSCKPSHYATQSPVMRCRCCVLRRWSYTSLTSGCGRRWPASASCCHRVQSWGSRSRLRRPARPTPARCVHPVHSIDDINVEMKILKKR